MSEQDPQRILDDTAMNWRQYVVVAIMVALNALDGFDVLSSAFAAPGISKEWGVSREALGIVLSAELVGMGFGSIILGGIADKTGSLEVGKMADVVLWNGNPFSVYSRPERVWIDGAPVYERGKQHWSDFELGQAPRPPAPGPSLLPGGAP